MSSGGTAAFCERTCSEASAHGRRAGGRQGSQGSLLVEGTFPAWVGRGRPSSARTEGPTGESLFHSPLSGIQGRVYPIIHQF